MLRGLAERQWALTVIAGALSLLGALGCDVDSPVPPSVTARPKLEPEAPGDSGCSKDPAYKDRCSGSSKASCCHPDTCVVLPEMPCDVAHSQECYDDRCHYTCDPSLGEAACANKDEQCDVALRLCLNPKPAGCTTSADCACGGLRPDPPDSGPCPEMICELSLTAVDGGPGPGPGVCVSPIKPEPDPGCSAVGAGPSGSALVVALSALALAAARARRRAR